VVVRSVDLTEAVRAAGSVVDNQVPRRCTFQDTTAPKAQSPQGYPAVATPTDKVCPSTQYTANQT
jgi:hypothetical protein